MPKHGWKDEEELEAEEREGCCSWRSVLKREGENVSSAVRFSVAQNSPGLDPGSTRLSAEPLGAQCRCKGRA